MTRVIHSVMDKVFGYVRVSGKAQIDKDGPVRQREAIKDFCIRQNLELVEIFEDLAVSGTIAGEDREGFADLLVAAKEFGVKAVIVEKMDRLARDVVVSEYMIRELASSKLKLYSAELGLQDMVTHPTDEPSRTFIRQILAASAQYEKSALVLKLRAARKRKKEQTGKCEGQKGYGATKVEKITLNLISQLRESGSSWESICAMLNAAGNRKRNGSEWDAVNLYRIFTAAVKRQQQQNERTQLGHLLHISSGASDQ